MDGSRPDVSQTDSSAGLNTGGSDRWGDVGGLDPPGRKKTENSICSSQRRETSCSHQTESCRLDQNRLRRVLTSSTECLRADRTLTFQRHRHKHHMYKFTDNLQNLTVNKQSTKSKAAHNYKRKHDWTFVSGGSITSFIHTLFHSGSSSLSTTTRRSFI